MRCPKHIRWRCEVDISLELFLRPNFDACFFLNLFRIAFRNRRHVDITLAFPMRMISSAGSSETCSREQENARRDDSAGLHPVAREILLQQKAGEWCFCPWLVIAELVA